MNNIDDKLLEIEADLYKLMNKHITAEDINTLYALAAVMMKVSVQLYTVAFKNDEDIEKMVEAAKQSIPNIRKTFSKVRDVTIH
jgi:hypothetical protein